MGLGTMGRSRLGVAREKPLDSVSGDDFKIALLVLTWVMRLWAVVVLAVAAFRLRMRLTKPVAFAVLGSLICYGVVWLLAQTELYWRIDLLAETPADKLVAVVISSGVGLIVSSGLVSLAPVVWLYRILAVKEPPTDPKPSRR